MVATRAEAWASPTPTPFRIAFVANIFEIVLQNALKQTDTVNSLK